jgi:hypothetical protein
MRLGHYSLLAASLISVLTLGAARAGPGEPDVPDDLPTSDSPLAAAYRLFQSYGQRRIDEYAALFLPGYRFVLAEPWINEATPRGLSREDEIESARHLYAGFIDRCGRGRAAACSIEISFGALQVVDEPEKPDSTDKYQLVIAEGVRLRIARCDFAKRYQTQSVRDGRPYTRAADDWELLVGPGRHELHFVRGDVAARAPDQPGDADHWYLWLWVERPTLVIDARGPHTWQLPQSAWTADFRRRR